MSSRRLHDWFGRLRRVADQTLTRMGGEPGAANGARHRRQAAPLRLSDLEPRLLFSATPIDPALLGGGETATVLQIDVEPVEAATPSAVSMPTLSESNNQIGSKELIVIDASVPEIDALLDDLIHSRPDVEIYILDSERDGVAQISEILDGRIDITGLHLVSHAENSAVRLGNVWLGGDNLDGYAGEVASWQSSFASGADILFYGCDLAREASGREFLDAVGALTGTEVAASVNETGHADYHADWQLEYESGVIETRVAFSQQLQSNWTHKLASLTIYVNTFDDVVAADSLTSLREAIIQANANVGDDVTIVLQAGVYTRSLDAADDESAATGDLDVTRNVTILGAGIGQTVIDGNGQDRVFDIHGANLVMSDLTIQNGRVDTEGGGVRVNSGAGLTLQRVHLTDNNADRGGGIANDGNLTLIDVEISDSGRGMPLDEGGGLYNQSVAMLQRVTIAGNLAGDGAGIYNASDGDLTLINVTLSDNEVAPGEGGGLFNRGHVSILNSTIAGNSAEEGGGISNHNGTIVIRNTIVADNDANVGHNDVRGTVTGMGNNVVQNVAPDSGFTTSEQFSGGANLAALADNGGFVRTRALLAGSPALGSGHPTITPSVDARGVLRSDTNDVGAFQSSPARYIETGPLQVNTDTGSAKNTESGTRGSTSSIASDESGNYVVVWTSTGGQDGSGDGVYGQRFNASGQKIGGEFRINQTTIGDQKWASVAMNASGAFVVTWTTPGSSADESVVMARRYNASGLALGDAFAVSASSADGEHQTSVVAIDDEGGFAIAWATRRNTDDTWIYLRTYDNDGNEIGSVQTVDSMTGNLFGLNTPAIDTTADGRTVVAWERSGDVRFQIFDANGNPVGTSVTVPEASILLVSTQPDVAIANDGSIVVTWSEGLFPRNVFMQRFSDVGAENGERVIVHSDATVGDQASPSIAMKDSGEFMISWSGMGPGDDDGIFLQKFDAAGNTLGDITRVNDETIGNQRHASLTMLDSDNFVVAWSDSNVFVRQYGTGSAFSSNQSPQGVADEYVIDKDTTLNSASDWYDLNWMRRRTLSFNNEQTSNVTDFPVLIRLDATRIDYSQTQNAGQDLRFVDRDGTLLAHEIESWDESGESYVWVRVPQIDASSTTDSILMYYGNASAIDGQNAVAVWAGNANAVYHFTNGLLDSTANNNDGTNFGSSNTDGLVGEARAFDGVDDMVRVTQSPTINDLFVGGGTVTVTFNASGWGEDGFGRLVDKSSGVNLSPNGWSLQLDEANSSILFEIGFHGPHGRWRAEPNAIALNQWNEVILAYDGDSSANVPDIYINGVLQTLVVSNSPINHVRSDANLDIHIGNYADGTRSFQGVIDEVRLIDEKVSALWVAAQQSNRNDELVTFGYQQSAAGVLGNDVDPDGDTLIASLVSGPSHSQSFQLNLDGTFTYTPVLDFDGIDTFVYRATDGDLQSDLMTVLIRVNAANDPAEGIPLLRGVATVGETLSADTSPISDSDGLGVFEYSWYRSGVLLGGQSASTYSLTTADVGETVQVSVRFVDGRGHDEGPLLSIASNAVKSAPAPPIPIVTPPPRDNSPSPPPVEESKPSDEKDSRETESDSTSDDSSGPEALLSLDPLSIRPTEPTSSTTAAVAKDAAVMELAVQNRASEASDTQATSDALLTQMSQSFSERSTRSRGDSGAQLDSFEADDREAETRALVMADYALLMRPGAMWEQLDNYQQSIDSRIQGDLIVVGSASAAASSFTVGIVAWAMRSGFLVSGLIAHMPAWSGLDPLLIMNGIGGAGDAGNETLEELMQRQDEELSRSD